MEKVAVIMRGVPGSGKSTVANILKAMTPDNIAIHSTDDFFVRDGVYKWSADQLYRAHEWNKDEFYKSVNAGVLCVVCDNTNLGAKEYKPYIQMAKSQGYKVVAVVFEPHAIGMHTERNVHNVPVDSIMNMMNKLINNMETVGADEIVTITTQMSLPEVEKAITDKFVRYCH
jgi:predicted kinase